MGDHGAVDYALGAQEPRLEKAEVLTDETWVRSDRVFPTGPVAAGVAIDDLGIIAKVPRAMRVEDVPREQRPDLPLFERAEAAYVEANFEGTPAKDRQGCSTDVLIGTELQGREGYEGAPRDCALVLSLLSLFAATLPLTTPYALDVLSGTWTALFLARRPLLGVLHGVKKDRG